jgi:formylglycine-generating enzyme required for sulfatase activity
MDGRVRHCLVLLALCLAGHTQGLDAEIAGIRDTTVTLRGGATMEFVWIDSGTFAMGSSDTTEAGPQRAVTITQGFLLGKYEVTQRQWESVMGTGPWTENSYVTEEDVDAAKPAMSITWGETQALVRLLNLDGGTGTYHLPTEAEWEYACRAGTTTLWSFGDDASQLEDYAWYSDNAWHVGAPYVHQVGTKLPNPWGLHDMHGNVDEWCQDFLWSYEPGPQTDPTGDWSGGPKHVYRGGFYGTPAPYTRSAHRDGALPHNSSRFVGTRLLMRVPTPTAVEYDSWGTVKSHARP